MGAANIINATYSTVLRAAGHQQTETGLLWVPPTIWIQSPRSDLGAVTRSPFREGILIRSFDLNNRSGISAAIGIGGRIANRWWIGGRLSADGATYTDLTSSLQSSTSTATLGVAGADQTGFVFGCRVPFNWLSVHITTAETNAGGSAIPDHTVQYSNASGTGWTTATTAASMTDNFTLTNTVLGAGAQNFVWAAPSDWGAWTSASSSGLPVGYYYLRVTSADREAGDGAPVATGAELGYMLAVSAVADGGIWEMENVDYYMPYADAVVAYFSNAGAGNRVYAEVMGR